MPIRITLVQRDRDIRVVLTENVTQIRIVVRNVIVKIAGGGT